MKVFITKQVGIKEVEISFGKTGRQVGAAPRIKVMR